MRYVRTGLLGTVAVVMIAGATPAQAKDDDDWSGGFIAIDGGGAAASARISSTDQINQVTNVNPAGAQPLTVVPGTTIGVDVRDNQTSLLYGVAAGVQGQSGNFVFGIEGDAHGPRDAGSGAQSVAVPGTILSPASSVVATREARTRYDWSARVRLGVAMGKTLLYASGGVAGAQVRLRAQDVYNLPAGVSPGGVTSPAFGPITTSASQTRTLTGWTAGAGIEHKLGSSGFTIGLDARYTDYGSKTYGLVGATTTASGSLVFTGAEPPTPNPIATPTATPGASRLSLNEFRVGVRLGFHF